MLTVAQLRKQQAELVAMEVAAGEPLFMHVPDRWYKEHRFRCVNGHVSRWPINCDLCPACQQPCCMTFPEDVDDPNGLRSPELHYFGREKSITGSMAAFEGSSSIWPSTTGAGRG